METRRLKLEGPSVRGRKVNGPLLREILALVIDGSQKALRLRTQGRSAARGTLPTWIAAATEFMLQIEEGSTILEIELPTLFEAAPEDFRQSQLFPEIDPGIPAVDYLISSIQAALRADTAAPIYDVPFLKFLGRLDNIFHHGVTTIEFQGGDREPQPLLLIDQSSVAKFHQLESRIPRPQHVNVAGNLDTIRYTDRTFVLALSEDQRIRGIAEHCDNLQDYWGKEVLTSGTAHFTVNGLVQRIEADSIRLASSRDLSLFSVTPEPLSRSIAGHELRRPQGLRSGLNAVFGKWPGEESDEEITESLNSLS